MGLHQYEFSLLSQNAASINVDQTGTAVKIIPNNGDAINDVAQGFSAFMRATQTGGVTAPTTDVKVQTSQDKVNWVDVATLTQLTADGTNTELDTVVTLSKWVRAVTVLGGATKPDHTVDVVLLSNAPFSTSAT